MQKALLGICLALVFVIGGALALRHTDSNSEDAHRAALLAQAPASEWRFDPVMVAGLPEVARRYFLHAIASGTLLSPVAELTMEGEFLLGGVARPMTARQVLVAPAGGFLWEAEIGGGQSLIPSNLTGSDGLLMDAPSPARSWTRFWWNGLFPVVRAGGTGDHARSAATRAMMESLWAPAALLPQSGAVWVQIGANMAEVRFPGLPGLAPMRLTLDAQGQVVQMAALRWSDANPERVYRLQPFGGRVRASSRINGLTIPTEVELGNGWGTPAYEPFFRARITAHRTVTGPRTIAPGTRLD